MTLNLNLSPELMLDLGLLQLGLEEDLQGHDVLGLLLTGQVYIAELALAYQSINQSINKKVINLVNFDYLTQWPTDIKILQSPAVTRAALWVAGAVGLLKINEIIGIN